MTGILRGPRRVALMLIATVMAAATVVALAQSYRALYDWARSHGVPGGWAAAWPLQVDTFLVVGELALFVALVDRWTLRARMPAWLVTLGGLAVSVAGNVGHVHTHDLLVRATAAVPPVAAALALAIGLGVLKRVVAFHHETTVKATVPATAGTGPKPPAKATVKATRKASSTGLDAATRKATEAIEQGQPVPSARALARDHHIGRDKAAQIRATVLASADGHAGQPGQLTST
jgi:Protein of unknown function (DUF2637)